MVLDSDGYVRLTDFGIARMEKDASEKDTSGTPGYMGNQLINLSTRGYV